MVLGATSPVLVLFSQLPKPVQALPAALGAFAAAILASFHWHEDAVRWAAVREQLKRELRQMSVRAGRYDGLSHEAALNHFVLTIEAIMGGELRQWEQQEHPLAGHSGEERAPAEGMAAPSG